MLMFACMSVVLSAQTYRTISGAVKDAAGEGIIGAGVVVQGTSNGVITAPDGTFTLKNVPTGASVVVSCVGYKTQVALATNGMTVVLAEDNEALDETIVVAYGTSKKSSFTGSASVV